MSDSPLAPAVDAFFNFSIRAESLTHLTHEGLALLVLYRDVLVSQAAPDEQLLERAEHNAKYAEQEIARDFSTLHANSLLGLWGAFECFVEDLFTATLEAQPELLTSDAFAKVKLPVAMMVGGEQRDRLQAVLTEVTRAAGSDLAQGVNKFERILAPVGLGGMVPTRIRDAIYQAQQIRNVWAHRGGMADERFVERCPHLGFGVGETVSLDAPTFLHLMHGLHMYAMVILNRSHDKLGVGRLPGGCVGYEGCMAEVP